MSHGIVRVLEWLGRATLLSALAYFDVRVLGDLGVRGFWMVIAHLVTLFLGIFVLAIPIPWHASEDDR